eukprot:tig00001600_g9393.t1
MPRSVRRDVLPRLGHHIATGAPVPHRENCLIDIPACIADAELSDEDIKQLAHERALSTGKNESRILAGMKATRTRCSEGIPQPGTPKKETKSAAEGTAKTTKAAAKGKAKGRGKKKAEPEEEEEEEGEEGEENVA